MWPFEQWCFNRLKKDGWFVARNHGKGMPDFICWHPRGELKMVECKLNKNDLTGTQPEVFASLHHAGVTIEIYRGTQNDSYSPFVGWLEPWEPQQKDVDAAMIKALAKS
jgi:hypothetical protein